jgi:hypothetical protein
MSTTAGEAFASPTHRHGRDWPRLLMPQYGLLESAAIERKQSVVKLLLDQCQITGPDRFVFLREHLAAPIAPVEVKAYTATKPGTHKALDLSLRMAGVESEAERNEAIEALPYHEASILAGLVAGFLEEVPPEADGSDPTPPGGTGATTPGLSESSAPSTPTV